VFPQNNAEALAKGMRQNLPVTDALSEEQIVSRDFYPYLLFAPSQAQSNNSTASHPLG
jgi:hypothetical protein